MITSIQTLQGKVYIHPRVKRPDREGSRCITLQLAIVGYIPAKKNNQVPVSQNAEAERYAAWLIDNRPIPTMDDYRELLKKTRAIIVPSSRHQRWHLKTSEDIKYQMARAYPRLEKNGLSFPLTNCSMSIYHYWKDKKLRDLGNRMESVADLIKDCSLISDDNDQVLGPILMDAGRYPGELIDHTTIINLTTYFK